MPEETPDRLRTGNDEMTADIDDIRTLWSDGRYQRRWSYRSPRRTEVRWEKGIRSRADITWCDGKQWWNFHWWQVGKELQEEFKRKQETEMERAFAETEKQTSISYSWRRKSCWRMVAIRWKWGWQEDLSENQARATCASEGMYLNLVTYPSVRISSYIKLRQIHFTVP